MAHVLVGEPVSTSPEHAPRKQRTPGRHPFPVFVRTLSVTASTELLRLAFTIGLPGTSEGAQQDRGDEHESREGCEHVQPQGQVHVWPPSLLWRTIVYQSLSLDRSGLHAAPPKERSRTA